MNIHFEWLGLCKYDVALNVQMLTAQNVQDGGRDVVIACQHPNIVTLGKRAVGDEDLVAPREMFQELKIEIAYVDRGGQAVFHNPGQLVIYPIIDLKRNKLTVKEYVYLLEEVTERFLETFGVEVTRSVEPGLWVNDKKIAYLGIRVDQGVTRHGVAINITNDVSIFHTIKQCGAQIQATNLLFEVQKEGMKNINLELKSLADQWMEIFCQSLRVAQAQFKPSVSSQDHAMALDH